MEQHYDKGLDLYKAKDYDGAFQAFETGAKLGDPRCIYSVGIQYYKGLGTGKDELKGAQLIKKSVPLLFDGAKRGLPKSKWLIYLAYKGFSFLKAGNDFFLLLKDIKDHDCKNADGLSEQNVIEGLANCYWKGIGTLVNLEAAYSLFEESFEKFRSKYALSMLIACYIYGFGTKQNLSKAFGLVKIGYEIDADSFAESLVPFYLGIDYYHGISLGEFEDLALAKAAINKMMLSAKERNGTAGAIYNVMLAFLSGESTKISYDIVKRIDLKNETNADIYNTIWNQVCHAPANKAETEKREVLSNLLFQVCEKQHGDLSENIFPYYTMANFYKEILHNNPFFALSETEETDYRTKYLDYLKTGCQKGDALAFWEYSLYLLDNSTSRVDETTAFEYMRKSVAQYDQFTRSLNGLGIFYEYGIGTSIDIKKAEECYKKSIHVEDEYANGSKEAIVALAYLLDQVVATPESKRTASSLLKEANPESIIEGALGLEGDIRAIRLAGKWDDGQKIFWLTKLRFDYGDKSSLCSLADCYRTGDGVDRDISKAIQLLEQDTSRNKPLSLLALGDIYYQGIDVPKDIDKAYNFFTQSITCSKDNSCNISESYFSLFKISTDRNCKFFNPSKGKRYLLEVIKACESSTSPFDFDRIQSKGEACYSLGWLYANKEFGLQDSNKAKDYFTLASELGVNCSYALESLHRDEAINHYYVDGTTMGRQKGLEGWQIDKFAKRYAREKYVEATPKGLYKTIERLKLKGLSGEEKKSSIEKMLKEDFQGIWDDLKEEAKRSLITALFIYGNFIDLGYETYSSLDFSPVINGMSKAFEIELKEFFYKGFLEYIKSNGISFKEFVDESSLVQIPFIESTVFIDKGRPSIHFGYTSDNEGKSFSLGSVYFIVTSGQNKRFTNRFHALSEGLNTRATILGNQRVNSHLVDYFDSIFSERSFNSSHRKEDIANYLLDFAEDVRTIKMKRNPGSHDSALSADDAELCADYLLIVKKLIYTFLAKIKPEYRKSQNSKQSLDEANT